MRFVTAIGFEWTIENILRFIIGMFFKSAGVNEFVSDDDQPDTVSSIALDLFVLFRTLLLSWGPDLRLGMHKNVGFEYLAAVLNRGQ